MDTLQAKTVRDLAVATDRDCVSVFMPILRGEDVGLQNAIRLKNLLTAVKTRLIERGWRTTAAREMVNALRERTEQTGYWDDGSQGLAIFASEGRAQLYRLPAQVPEFWTVGERFHITPLLGAESDGEFFILALDQNSCRVLRGHRWDLEEVQVPGLPASRSEAVGSSEPLFAHEAHGAGCHGDQRMTIFTGQGGASDYLKPEIEEYFRAVDRAVTKYLGVDGQRPLVFAGVHSMLPLYRSVNSYRGLEGGSIDGNPELLSLSELHRRAWAIVEPRFHGDQQRVLANLQAHGETDLATCDLPAILAAAHEGRVESLVVAAKTCCWGKYDAATGDFRLEDEHASDACDLLNWAAVETIRHGGEVFAIELEPLGMHEVAAAVLRYSAATPRDEELLPAPDAKR